MWVYIYLYIICGASVLVYISFFLSVSLPGPIKAFVTKHSTTMIRPSLTSLSVALTFASSLVPVTAGANLARCQTTGPNRRCRDTTGCGQTPSVKAGEFKDYTTPEGREYRVWLPASYDAKKPTPLILSYHGAGGTKERQMELDELTTPLFNTDHIMVYLQGTAVSFFFFFFLRYLFMIRATKKK